MKFIEDFLDSGSIISSKPGYVVVGYGNRSWLKNPSQSDRSHFYFPDYFLLEKTPWCTHECYEELAIDELIKLLLPKTTHTLPKILWSNPHQSDFERAFSDLQIRFANKELQKAVPFVFEKACVPMQRERLASSLIGLLNNTKEFPLHMYGFWENGNGMIGATPEVLFSIQTNVRSTLKTMACAGTRSARHNTRNSLLNDPKELREHQFVVDDIVSALTPFGTPTLDPIKETQLPGLSHLMTPIQLELQGEWTFESLVHALHPTPALGAFPRKEGREWLLRYQTIIGRKRFGAPAGFLAQGKKSATCLVAIRNVQWNRNEMAIGAGCGVISDSLLKNEWDEIQIKLRAVKQMLNL